MWSVVFVGTTAWYLSAVFAQEPRSPCPDVFQYNLGSDGTWRGEISILPRSQILRITIRVQLYLTSALANKYVGHLSLAENKDTIAAKIIKGNIEPIRYTLLFPLVSPLPTIDRINVNGETICIGPRVSAPVLTKISLEHTLIAAVSASPGRGDPRPISNSNPQSGIVEIPYPMMPWDVMRPNPQEVQKPMQPSQTTHEVEFHPFKPPIIDPPPQGQSVPQSAKPPQQLPPPWTTDLRKQSTTLPPTQTEGNPQEISGQFSSEPPQTHQIVKQSTKDVCGHSVMANELVFHGKSTTRGEWPWIAAIFFTAMIGKLQFQCGGTLINTRHLVTAGHCVKQRDDDGSFSDVLPSDLVVILGIYRLRRIADAFSQAREVEEIFIHPDFQKTPSYDADIAVLKFATSVEYTQYVRPICLWPFISDLGEIIGKHGTVVGWGRDELGNKSTNEPHRADVPIVSQLDCLRNRTEFVTITSDRTFCAGFRNNSGPCNGDSGSGLVLSYTMGGVSRWFLRGVTSVSLYDSNEGRCDLNNYVVFTDVAKFGKWMQQFERDDEI